MQEAGGASSGLQQGQGADLGRKTSTNPTELDPEVPKTAKDVPLGGLAPGENATFKEQVQGHAKMFAGKIFGNDKEVQEGAARIRGLEEQQQQQQ